MSQESPARGARWSDKRRALRELELGRVVTHAVCVRVSSGDMRSLSLGHDALRSVACCRVAYLKRELLQCSDKHGGEAKKSLRVG